MFMVVPAVGVVCPYMVALSIIIPPLAAPSMIVPQTLRQVSERLCAALDERANESTVVADVSDVMQAHEHEITVALYHYCTLNTEVRTPCVISRHLLYLPCTM